MLYWCNNWDSHSHIEKSEDKRELNWADCTNRLREPTCSISTWEYWYWEIRKGLGVVQKLRYRGQALTSYSLWVMNHSRVENPKASKNTHNPCQQAFSNWNRWFNLQKPNIHQFSRNPQLSSIHPGHGMKFSSLPPQRSDRALWRLNWGTLCGIQKNELGQAQRRDRNLDPSRWWVSEVCLRTRGAEK